MTATAPHPAKFSAPLLPVIAGYLQGYRKVLDPMAGVGTLARYLKDHYVTSSELEPEWVAQCPHPRECQDATDLPIGWAEQFDAIATSPTYGNRMADCHNAQERCRACRGSGDETYNLGGGEFWTFGDTPCPKCEGTGRRKHKRHTYRHYLGRPLTPGNTGQMQWGQDYRDTHEAIIAECVRVLRPGGRVVWNVKNHTRKGVEVDVVAWHGDALEDAGLTFTDMEEVLCPGQRHGQNGAARVDHEWVLVFDKTEATA